jgi:prephenate dehydrogenase
VGRGLRDTTRIASGPPDLWCEILGHNAGPVTEILEALVRDLTESVSVLRNSGLAGTGPLTELLVKGNLGRNSIMSAAPPHGGTA